MEPIAVIDIAVDGIETLLKLALPILLVALFVGVSVALLQALTQVQEPTLSFVPKVISVFLMMLFLLPYMGDVMSTFVNLVFSTMINLE
jgi:flagellar biosynthetic protein FliQ